MKKMHITDKISDVILNPICRPLQDGGLSFPLLSLLRGYQQSAMQNTFAIIISTLRILQIGEHIKMVE